MTNEVELLALSGWESGSLAGCLRPSPPLRCIAATVSHPRSATRGLAVPALSLSLRDVEELLAERGVAVTYETIGQWVRTFGAVFARDLRRRGRRRQPARSLTTSRAASDERMWRGQAAPDRTAPRSLFARLSHLGQARSRVGAGLRRGLPEGIFTLCVACGWRRGRRQRSKHHE